MIDCTKDAIRCFQEEAQAILNLIPQLDDDFNRVIELIYKCKGKFIVTGVGKSGHIGAKIAATLASTGTPSFFLNPLDAYHGDLGMISKNDVIMAISYSGQTDELLRFLPLLIDRKIPIIGMSGNPKSLLAKYSDYHLNIAIRKEACPLNLVPTSSTTATLAMGDAIACALIRRRRFKPSDFALYHPGGTIGRKLLAQVKDYMHSDNLPMVKLNDKVSEAIIEISKARLGIAVVMENDQIKGVITDGDVRRSMQQNQKHFFDLMVQDIMSENPISIIDTAKLTEAEALFGKHNIHTLIVVDEDNKLKGIIDTVNLLLNYHESSGILSNTTK